MTLNTLFNFSDFQLPSPKSDDVLRITHEKASDTVCNTDENTSYHMSSSLSNHPDFSSVKSPFSLYFRRSRHWSNGGGIGVEGGRLSWAY